jgi:hypothetical protein
MLLVADNGADEALGLGGGRGVDGHSSNLPMECWHLPHLRRDGCGTTSGGTTTSVSVGRSHPQSPCPSHRLRVRKYMLLKLSLATVM